MFRFYFHFHMGELTAWIQTITAAVAAILLLRTMRLQASYTAAQLQITGRDELRFIRESEPVINFDFFDGATQPGYNQSHIRLTVHKNPVHNLRFTSVTKDHLVTVTAPSKPLSINIESPVLMIYELNQAELDEPSPDGHKVLFHLTYTYQDKMGNQYSQHAWAELGQLFYHDIPVLTMASPEKNEGRFARRKR